MFGKKYDRDQQSANDCLNGVLDALENMDKDALISLFAKEVVSGITDFASTADSLLAYYQGTTSPWNDRCPMYVDTTYENGQQIKLVYASYDVNTSEQSYRIAIKLCAADDYNPNHVGIWSLYIIKTEEDVDSELAYWGDGKDTPGINIGIPNVI